jgi:hypothetical protein
MHRTRQSVVRVVWGKEASLVPLGYQLCRKSLGMPADTAWIRVRVRGNDPDAH